MTRYSISGAAVFLACLLCGPAMAGQGWLTEEEVTKKITGEAGYSHVTLLEAQEDRWEGQGMRDGKLMKFEADPHTGEILKEDVDK